MSVIRCQCTHHLHDHKFMQACKRCSCKFFKDKGAKAK